MFHQTFYRCFLLKQSPYPLPTPWIGPEGVADSYDVAHSPKPTFVPSLSEISDLSYVNSPLVFL